MLIGFDCLSYVTLRLRIIQVTLQRRKQHIVVQRVVQKVNFESINSLFLVRTYGTGFTDREPRCSSCYVVV